MTVKDLVGVVVVGVVLAVIIVRGLLAAGTVDELTAELDRLRSERLEAVVDSLGWEQRIASETEDLARQLQEARDENDLLATEKADLAREVETLGGRLAYVTDMYAGLASSLETAETTVFVDSVSNQADSVTAPLDDGLLSGRVAYRFGPSTFHLDYRVALALSLAMVDLPDGRQQAIARAADPRVDLRFGELYYEAPEPVRTCSLGQRAQTAAWSIGGWKLIELVAGLAN